MERRAGYGICAISTMLMRKEPKHQAAVVSQLLFGEAYAVEGISDCGKWLFITNAEDSYPGWIDAYQYQEVSEAYYNRYQKTPHHYLTSAHGSVWVDGQSETLISIGSVLPFYERGKADLGFTTVKLTAGALATQATGHVFDTAQLLIGVPYVWGGRSIFGMDCSGFIQQLFKLHGLRLRRDSRQQARYGEAVKSIENALPGDLAFFEQEGQVDHVGMILPDNKIIHSLGKVRVDSIDAQGIRNVTTDTYTHQLSFIRRVIYISEPA